MAPFCKNSRRLILLSEPSIGFSCVRRLLMPPGVFRKPQHTTADSRACSALLTRAASSIGQSQHLAQRSAHDHLASFLWNVAGVEHGVILVHHYLHAIEIRV